MAAASFAAADAVALPAAAPAFRASSEDSRSDDSAEREADTAARAVLAMARPRRRPGEDRLPTTSRHRERSGGDTEGPAGGVPLPDPLRRDMEPRFRADFGAVRLHADAGAAARSRALAARAFTVGAHIHFGAGQFQPGTAGGRALIAHELAHTVQQGAAPRLPGPATGPQLTPQPPGRIQRLGIGDALSYFTERAHTLPDFRLLTFVLGANPIDLRPVSRSAAQLLRAVVELMPGAALITQALERNGVLERAGAWVSGQLATLGLSARALRDALMGFLRSLGWRDVLDLDSVWERAQRMLLDPITRIGRFAGTLMGAVVQFVRDAVLKPLARLAEGTRGWDLLCAVLGYNPITGEAVARSAHALIGGFMKLIGQEQVWLDIQRAHAVPRAWAWFQGTLAGLLGFVRALPASVMQALRALALADLLLLPRAWLRVAATLGQFTLRFVSWAGAQVLGLLQIIFEVVAPGLMVYLRRAAGAFSTIVRHPVRFLGHLLRAAGAGLRQFAGNFLSHLRGSLVGWLTGAMSGADLHIPRDSSLREIVRFVLSVLGLTWRHLRVKLVRVVGERTVGVLERGFDVVVRLVRDGPAAVWERIVAGVGNLRDLVLQQVMRFVAVRVVSAAITRLLTSLNPVGAFVQAVLAIYNTVMFLVERLRQIAQVGAAVIDSLAAIAAGAIAAAANRVERTMAGLLTLVISFLARIAGLGRVSDAVVGIVNRLRLPIDQALDRVVAWIGTQARRLVAGARATAARVVQWWNKVKRFRGGGQDHKLYFEGGEEAAELTVASTPRRLATFVADARVNRTTPGERAAVDRIEAQIPRVRHARSELRRLRRASAAPSALQPHLDALDDAFDVIGREIGGLLDGADAGTSDHPIDLDWPKPAWHKYPNLYLYRSPAGSATPWRLTARADGSTRYVMKYLPSGAHERGDTSQGMPPDELDHLGIRSPYLVQTGFVVGPLSDHSTPGGAALNNLLARYGWSPSAEGMDGDHVQEIQFGGQDVLENLWPLDASINRGAGSRLSRAPAQVGPERLTIDTLKRVRTRKFSFRVRTW